MKTIEFNPYKKTSLALYFECKKCGNTVGSEIYIEYKKPSWEEDDDNMYCLSCNEVYIVRVWKSAHGTGHIKIKDLTDDDEVRMNAFWQSTALDYLLDPSTKITDFKKAYDSSISKIEKLNQIEISDSTVCNYHKNLLFSSIITSLEAYLSDACIYLIINNTKYRRNFLKVYKIKQEKLEENLEGRSFHNLEKARDIYERSFKIEFTGIEHLLHLIDKRHDIVHRNGKMKGEEEMFWKTSKAEIEDIIIQINVLVQEVEDIIVDL